MENLLQGIPHVSIYLDDILLTGNTEAEHLATLDKVLTKLETAGFRLKKNKCAYLLTIWDTESQQKDCNQQKTKSELSRKHQHLPMFNNHVHFWDW